MGIILLIVFESNEGRKMMKVCFLGGAKEVGASCIFVELDGKKLLFDCGIRQGGAKDVLPDFRSIQELGGLDAIIISHAHMDHTGALPIISKEYPQARIYMNNMTKDLLKVLLYDSLKIMNNREAEIPLYAQNDVEAMFDRVFTLNYQHDFAMFEGMKLTFYAAGHIAGAGAAFIQSEKGSLFYSGDFSIFPQRSIDGAKIPRLRPDVAIMESTYGDKLHGNREVEEERLIDLVQKGIDEGAKMLIPSFALGRAQEVLLILKSAMNRGKLSKVKVYVDGMVKDINRVYKNNPLYLRSSLGKKILKGTEPFYDDYITMVTNNEEREKLLQSKEAAVIVASSGMMTGGPSQFYGERIATMENGYIIITGYQDEESPGRKLLNLLELPMEERRLEINSRSLPVKCNIERVGLSAHGDKSEIKAIVELLSPKNVFYVHGEEGVIEGIASETVGNIRGRVYAPKVGDRLDVWIGNPRKQINRQLTFMLNATGELDEKLIEGLWLFIRENYGDRLFTLEELLYICRGRDSIVEDDMEEFKKLILNTPYFENDLRRFFMFRVSGEQTVQENLKPKELKQNEIKDLAEEYFKDYGVKKVSIIEASRAVVLNFDFPKALNQDIYKVMETFKENTNWEVDINPQSNLNAADILIRGLLPFGSINKISYMLNENKVVISINEVESDLDIVKEEYENSTGFKLSFIENKKKSTVSASNVNNTKFECGNVEKMEQNAAIGYIDHCFKYEEA